MKNKNFSRFFFITLGILGLILFIFGLQFNGTLCDEIQQAGLLCMGIFALWGILNTVNAYMKQKELENM